MVAITERGQERFFPLVVHFPRLFLRFDRGIVGSNRHALGHDEGTGFVVRIGKGSVVGSLDRRVTCLRYEHLSSRDVPTVNHTLVHPLPFHESG